MLSSGALQGYIDNAEIMPNGLTLPIEMDLSSIYFGVVLLCRFSEQLFLLENNRQVGIGQI